MRELRIVLSLLVWLRFDPLQGGGGGLVYGHEHHASIRQQQPQQQQADERTVTFSRKLQRTAAYCADYPETFSTSLYVNHVGDGTTSFQKTDLDSLLKMALTTYNQLATEACDSTFRTLQAVSVSNVYYTDKLDFVRLRYDFTGQCDGCFNPNDPRNSVSGIGPLFGGYENGKYNRRRTTTTTTTTTTTSTTATTASRRIKGTNHHRSSNNKKKNGHHQQQQLRRLWEDDEEEYEADDHSSTERTLAQSRKKSYYNPCYCNSRSGYGLVTPTLFATRLNEQIQSARASGTLSGVSAVEEIFEAGIAGHSSVVPASEARDVGCANPSDFTTDVWVEFDFPARDLFPNEKLPMEVAMLETFNEMNLLTCDAPLFRLVTDVTYLTSRATQDKMQLKFQVSGRCVNCNPSTVKLFDTTTVGGGLNEGLMEMDPDNDDLLSNGGGTLVFRAPSRTLLMAEIERLEQIQQTSPFMIYRDNPTSCVCPLNQGSGNEGALLLRSPTTSEFAQILQSTINTLRNENKITSVASVVRVAEGEIDATCSTGITTFVSTVFADFDGRPEDLRPSEISQLEGGFTQTYNDLAFDSCDQYFRSVSGVRLIPGVSARRRRRNRRELRQRSLQATNVGNAANSSDVPDLQSEVPSVYMVAGECRGCPVRAAGSFPLLDDAFRFRKLMVGGQEESIACYTYGSAVNGLPTMVELNLPPGGKGEDAITRVRNEERRLEQCLCAPGAIPDNPNAPQIEEFRKGYNNKIVEYNEAGSVNSVQEVTQMEEVPPGLVLVGFSLYYGTLERLGTPTDADYKPLLAQTNTFYRRFLFSHYRSVPGLTLRSVTITKGDTTVRQDLDMLQIDYTAELIFNEAPVLPSPTDITVLMAEMNYVDYITDYIWSLNTMAIAATGARPSIFRRAHSVRFAGQEDRLVDLEMLFTLKSGITPNKDDREGLGVQINEFFIRHLKNSGLPVVSFMSHIAEEDVVDQGNGSVLVDFDATIVFSTEDNTPSEAQILTILKAANLDGLKTQMTTAPPVGTSVFDAPSNIVFNQVP